MRLGARDRARAARRRPPAGAAETLGRSAVTAGPVLAGGSVLWADAPSGRPRVLRRRAAAWCARAGRARTRRTRAAPSPRWPARPPRGRGGRDLHDPVDFDAVFLGCAERAFGGPRFAPFGRPLPRRGPRAAPARARRCRSPPAPAWSRSPRPRSARGSRAPRPRARASCCTRAAPSDGRLGRQHVRIAGRYLAYLDGGRGARCATTCGRAQGAPPRAPSRRSTCSATGPSALLLPAPLPGPGARRERRAPAASSGRQRRGRRAVWRARALGVTAAAAGSARAACTLARAAPGAIGGFDLGPRPGRVVGRARRAAGGSCSQRL